MQYDAYEYESSLKENHNPISQEKQGKLKQPQRRVINQKRVEVQEEKEEDPHSSGAGELNPVRRAWHQNLSGIIKGSTS